MFEAEDISPIRRIIDLQGQRLVLFSEITSILSMEVFLFFYSPGGRTLSRHSRMQSCTEKFKRGVAKFCLTTLSIKSIGSVTMTVVLAFSSGLRPLFLLSIPTSMSGIIQNSRPSPRIPSFFIDLLKNIFENESAQNASLQLKGRHRRSYIWIGGALRAEHFLRKRGL